MNLDIMELMTRLEEQLRAQLTQRAIENPLMIGIHTGGAWIAEHLHQRLGIRDSLGTLDISFYRDDFSRIGMQPKVRPSDLPLSVDDRHIILVDDVLYTGRTIRAALNEIFDYGRPASVMLVALIVRNGRELPVQADISGEHLDLDPEQNIKLSGPQPLTLKIVNRSDIARTPSNP